MLVETEENKGEAVTPTNKDCIFGADIKKNCNVRIEIEQSDPMERYIKRPAVQGENSSQAIAIFAQMAELMSKINTQRSQLASFCGRCPFVQIYIANNPTTHKKVI